MEKSTVSQPAITELKSRRALVSAASVGAGVGLAGWLLSLLVQNFFVIPVFCRSADDFGVCASGGTIAWAIAFVIVGVVSVFALVRTTVYRPLLVVLAAFVALWGIAPWLAPLAWYWALLWSTILFALAYALFAWLATIERFLYSFIATALVVVLVRLALMQ